MRFSGLKNELNIFKRNEFEHAKEFCKHIYRVRMQKIQEKITNTVTDR